MTHAIDAAELPPVLIAPEQLSERVAELGRAISVDALAEGRSPLLVLVVLKGAVLFAADLVRQLQLPVELEFVRLSSYGAATASSGTVVLHPESMPGVAERHVLVVEDIVDTGLSMQRLLAELTARGAASVRVCTLLHKPARTRVTVPLDYVGFTIEDRFVVGYGLDHAERHRNLPWVGVL